MLDIQPLKSFVTRCDCLSTPRSSLTSRINSPAIADQTWLMGLTEMHLRPFDAQGFVLLVEMYINSALYSLAVANMPASNDPTGRNISTNETRRLVRLQLPMFVKVADVTRSVDRLQAVREAVEHVESRADRLLADIARRRATRSEFDPSRLRLPGSRQKARFFSDVFRRCEIALMSESGGSRDRLPEISFAAFDAVSAALTAISHEHRCEEPLNLA